MDWYGFWFEFAMFVFLLLVSRMLAGNKNIIYSIDTHIQGKNLLPAKCLAVILLTHVLTAATMELFKLRN